MRILGFLATAGLVLTALAVTASAQGGPPARTGGFIPGQKRDAGDPAQIERGKKIYGIACRSCHGADLRGGDMGGPNLLRSQLSLSDKDGEQIVPVILGGRQGTGMPAVPMSQEDAKATAAYLRSVLGTIGRQGMPPSTGKEAPSILVGNAKEGQVYFGANCAGCHSAAGDLKGIATRIKDPKILQNAWVAGGARERRGPPSAASKRRTVTLSVSLPDGRREQGALVRMDDFLVSLMREDGSFVSFRRDGDSPQVEVQDPLQPHRDMLSRYSDKDIHDVTAYLVTLK